MGVREPTQSDSRRFPICSEAASVGGLFKREGKTRGFVVRGSVRNGPPLPNFAWLRIAASQVVVCQWAAQATEGGWRKSARPRRRRARRSARQTNWRVKRGISARRRKGDRRSRRHRCARRSKAAFRSCACGVADARRAYIDLREVKRRPGTPIWQLEGALAGI